jgi:hypothetical protein
VIRALRIMLVIPVVWPLYWWTLGVQTLRKRVMRRFSGLWTLRAVVILLHLQVPRETLQAINDWAARDRR